MKMKEVRMPAGGGAKLQMARDEEETAAAPQEGLRGKMAEGVQEEAEPPPVQIIPIPVQHGPAQTGSPPTASSTVQSAGSPLGFRVNGQLVVLQPGGGGAELKLHSHPVGSASGFTSVQIPVTLTFRSPTGTQHVSTTASLSASTLPSHPAPIITGVISGEAAQKVLNDHNVNFKLLKTLKTSPSAVASPLTSPQATPTPTPAAVGTNQCPSSQPAVPNKLLRRGELSPVRPPDCPICTSQYKLITELRGFMCLCSSAVAESLKMLRKKKTVRHHGRIRDKPRISKPSRDPQSGRKASRSRPGLAARVRRASDGPQSDRFSSSASSLCSPAQQDPSGPPVGPPLGKLVILVEDFYYGSAPGRHRRNSISSGPYRCVHCPTVLDNNLKLMRHMQHHASVLLQQDAEMDPVYSCPHCFRHFLSALRLQSHVEAVHSQSESTVTCRICELAFDSEPAFLWHMKTTHKPGEMPYVCQVCGFRSSFYSDVWFHFEEEHANTRNLMCQYCLRVLRRNTCYQQHFTRHQKKRELCCDKCRLHFLYVRELVEHRVLYHRTHVRPPQLSGLKPGTKVTVRTYAVVGGSEGEDGQGTPVAPLKVVDVTSPPPSQDLPRRKPMESLGLLLSSLSPDRISWLPQRCVECLNLVPDLRIHFPSVVHCSLCKFITCCSTSYANHMINNHSTCRRVHQYESIFQSNSKLPQVLVCVTCKLRTCRGDLMANHLAERPKHTCVMLAHAGGHAVSQPGEGGASLPESDSGTSSGSRGGAFVPIQLLPSGRSSTQLSVKPLLSLSPVSSRPAMTIKILGPRPATGKAPTSLLRSQLSIVLCSLCHSVTQAARRYRTLPVTILSWTQEVQRSLPHRTWSWKTEEMAEWVLSRREQQLIVSEDVLLVAAKEALGGDGRPEDWYSWTVDFMLRHDLGLHAANRTRLKSVQDKSHYFIEVLNAQTRYLSPSFLGCMDEVPIFINLDQFSNQNPLSFQLYGWPEDTPLFDVFLSALSDGSFLPPLLFFTGTAPQIPEGFPDNVLLEARPQGFSDQERADIWIRKVWRPLVTSQCKSLLMVDVHRGHLTETFRSALSSSNTDIVFIPSGCSSVLQPLDVCVTHVLRDFLQDRWTQLVSVGGLDGLGLDQLALTLACWLSEFSSTLSSETNVLHRSFSAARSLQQVEDQVEVAKMISALKTALVQHPETGEPEPTSLDINWQ